MDDFNPQAAASTQRQVLQELSDIHLGLKEKVIDYYWNRPPETYEEDGRTREYIREYLREMERRIDDLTRNGPLRPTS